MRVSATMTKGFGVTLVVGGMLLLVFGCPDSPRIRTSSPDAVQKDSIIYLLPNTWPLFTCEVNYSAAHKTDHLEWLLDGTRHNNTIRKSTNSSLRITMSFYSGENLEDRELKCFGRVCGREVTETITVKVAKPVAEVKAYFGPNATQALVLKEDDQFEAYCIADGYPSPTFEWLAKYPGSSSWNVVDFNSNYSDYAVKEAHSGPTQFRCEANNFANRDSNVIASNVLELEVIGTSVKTKEAWTYRPPPDVDLESGSKTTDRGPTSSKAAKEATDSASDEEQMQIILMASISTSVIVLLLLIAGGAFAVMYYRKGKSRCPATLPMRTFTPESSQRDPCHIPAVYSTSTVYDHGYIDIIGEELGDPEKTADDGYLKPSSQPKFLPLPNIPGEQPGVQKRDIANATYVNDYHIYEEVKYNQQKVKEDAST